MAAEASRLTLTVLDGAMSVARLAPDEPVPDWVPDRPWCSVTRTADELSIVCESRFVPSGVRSNDGWRLLRVEGPLDFGLTGVLHRITAPLAAAKISLFTISTFDTDYVLVKEGDLEHAVAHLLESGLIVHRPD